jgi:hypothetical protein
MNWLRKWLPRFLRYAFEGEAQGCQFVRFAPRMTCAAPASFTHPPLPTLTPLRGKITMASMRTQMLAIESINRLKGTWTRAMRKFSNSVVGTTIIRQ